MPEQVKKRSLLPIQSAPVDRGEVIHPHRAVDVEHGDPEALFAIRMALLHGANYNDPAAISPRWMQRQAGACCPPCLYAGSGVMRRG